MLAITGANGHLGQRLLASLGEQPIRALVRSRRAAEALDRLGLGDRVAVGVVDYDDVDAMAEALSGCIQVVHLVGIIKESAGNSYAAAHEQSCRALAEAAARAGVQRIVYLSILGATTASANACLASKAAAEQILLDGVVPVTVIRVPMVLGEGDYASRALAARARRGVNVLLRGASLEQPIYAGDVIEAVAAVLMRTDGEASALEPGAQVFDLAGPESLSREALVHRAARVRGRRTRVISVPLGLGLAAAAVLERTSANPPVTRAMLGVLDHDDRINPQPALAALGIALTPLDEALRRCLS
ncbi:MAG: NAD(P)H-binding protein [Pseudomonadales bacterium]